MRLRSLLATAALIGSLGIGSIALAGTASAAPLLHPGPGSSSDNSNYKDFSYNNNSRGNDQGCYGKDIKTQGWDQRNFNQQDNWNNCFPQPKPPVNCHDQWGWQDSWVNVRGHETDHKTWGEGTCFTNYPEPKPAPKPCKCDVQTITFDFAPNLHITDGTWLLETGGPALYDGETLTYQGSTWTVEDWQSHGNGSLGNGKPYFILVKGGHDLSGSLSENPQVAHTICPDIHPLFA